MPTSYFEAFIFVIVGGNYSVDYISLTFCSMFILINTIPSRFWKTLYRQLYYFFFYKGIEIPKYFVIFIFSRTGRAIAPLSPPLVSVLEEFRLYSSIDDVLFFFHGHTPILSLGAVLYESICRYIPSTVYGLRINRKSYTHILGRCTGGEEEGVFVSFSVTRISFAKPCIYLVCKYSVFTNVLHKRHETFQTHGFDILVFAAA